MDINDKLKEMLILQKQLNDNTNGDGWEDGYTKLGKSISWRRAIYMESAELIDSFAWKHWKSIDAKPDWDNAVIEIIDIWHFILSELLTSKKDINDLVEIILANDEFKIFIEQDSKREEDFYKIIVLAEDLISSSINEDVTDILDSFCKLAMSCGVGMEDLFKYYIAKNILNKFRQSNGYKEGTYIKIWDGKEDNEVLMGILENSSTIQFNTIYDKLTTEYGKINNVEL